MRCGRFGFNNNAVMVGGDTSIDVITLRWLLEGVHGSRFIAFRRVVVGVPIVVRVYGMSAVCVCLCFVVAVSRGRLMGWRSAHSAANVVVDVRGAFFRLCKAMSSRLAVVFSLLPMLPVALAKSFSVCFMALSMQCCLDMLIRSASLVACWCVSLSVGWLCSPCLPLLAHVPAAPRAHE